MWTPRSFQLLSSLLFFSTFTIAYPWPKWLPELDALVLRQDTTSSSSTTTAQKTSSAPINSGAFTSSSAPINSGAITTSNTGTATSTSQTADSSSLTTIDSITGSSTHKAASTTQFDARLPAGGVSLATPNIASGSQFYKIGDYVTFGWNYTSLLATPTAINVMATCTANQELYTLAVNQTFSNATGAVTWDTGAYQATAVSNPLLTEVYTLIIYDAASSISATAQAGYLAVYDQYVFGMYVPQPRVDLNQWQCATCSGALSDIERRALGMVLGMSIITVMSFTWFVGGLRVIW
ncbi:hypothetical protein B7494_g5402 [Chlorociboria aeruginascens]|nr:hypothetical protein B7494_g5402 [Chlorociboria aeruginascens]